MRRAKQRIALVSLIAIAILLALYPRVPAPPPLFPREPSAARPAPLRPEPPPPAPAPVGPRMPTYRPPEGSTERMPVVGRTPGTPGELRVDPAVPRPSPGPT